MTTTAPQRLVVSVLGGASRLMWGFAPRTIPVVVERTGAAGALRWFAANMPRYLVTMAVLGPVRTHLACLTVSLRNGCPYCVVGHAYALELIYLRDRDRLFPLDAATLVGWTDLDDRQLRYRLHDLLERAGLHAEAIWVDRTLDLAGGAAPADATEARLAHIAEMVGFMNAVAVAAHVEPDGEAQNPINKDAALRARHASLWSASA